MNWLNRILYDRRKLLVGGLLLILTLLTGSVLGAEKSGRGEADERILFLHLKADSSGIRLIDYTLANGHLKKSKVPTRSHGVAFQVIDQAGENQFESIIENPLVKKYEYEDPNRPGELKMKVLQLDEAEFWVRVPMAESMDRIEFRLVDNRLSPIARRLDNRLTGAIDLTFLTEVKK